MDEKFRIIDDLTSDVMFEVYGKDLKELFENAATALFSIICQLDKVSAKDFRDIEMIAESPDELLFDFLQELIARVDIEEMFFSKFEVQEISETKLKARIWGEPVIPEKGETVVKALTYYGFSFEKTDRGYKTRIAVDI